MIYLFHGEEEFGRRERILALKAELGELDDINFVELDGRSLGRDEFQHYGDVLPFLGEHRMVVVNGLLARLGTGKSGGGSGSGSGAFLDWLVTYLPTVPDTTILVFNEAKSLGARHPVVKVVKKLGAAGEVSAFAAPSTRGGELARWVEQRAKLKGCRLDRGVAFDLANFIGPDLRLIDSELEKLAVYAGDRAITKADVRLLTPYAQDASIFDMVDALGHRQTRQAFKLLAQLRNEGAHPLYLLTMIVRQYRILLQVKDLSERRLDRNAIAKAIKLHPFPTGKAMEQARRYSAEQLASIYDRLLETDVAIKTGKMEANLALDLLVVELARA